MRYWLAENLHIVLMLFGISCLIACAILSEDKHHTTLEIRREAELIFGGDSAAVNAYLKGYIDGSRSVKQRGGVKFFYKLNDNIGIAL